MRGKLSRRGLCGAALILFPAAPLAEPGAAPDPAPDPAAASPSRRSYLPPETLSRTGDALTWLRAVCLTTPYLEQLLTEIRHYGLAEHLHGGETVAWLFQALAEVLLRHPDGTRGHAELQLEARPRDGKWGPALDLEYRDLRAGTVLLTLRFDTPAPPPPAPMPPLMPQDTL